LPIRCIKDLRISTEPVESAKEAGLRYVNDQVSGIKRVCRGKGFVYLDPSGKTVRDSDELERIRRLVIPPAWSQVWICTLPNGHLQATGRDARGRKQYRYHSRWREVRDSTKYERMLVFGKALPKIRRRVRRDLRRKGLSREKVLGGIVRLLQTTLMRIGNDEYARKNDSYGLTTLRNRHVRVSGNRATIEFKGKSHRHHVIHLNDPTLAKIVKRCRDLPGYELFQYLDQNGEPQKIRSDDVNEYLREITGQDFTAKDFRTWFGTVLTFRALQQFRSRESAAEIKRNIGSAIAVVARLLGNTPAVCKKCYIHPAILESYNNGCWPPMEASVEQEQNSAKLLRTEEEAVMLLLARKQ
jgi:DNA topoisomerase-1